MANKERTEERERLIMDYYVNTEELLYKFYKNNNDNIYKLLDELDEDYIEELINYYNRHNIVKYYELINWLWDYLDYREQK